MNYIDPKTVLSPKSRVSNVRVLFNGGENSWSAADIEWNKESRIGLRCNGSKNGVSRLGNPQSRGIATWFIVPVELTNVIREKVISLKVSKKK